MNVGALTFDVFGTVVDWRGGIAREAARIGAAPGFDLNGNAFALARRAGLPWDAILGAEVVRHHKPQPEAYRLTADFLGLAPEDRMMVAAQENDLEAAERRRAG